MKKFQWTIPNILTLFRFLCVALMIVMFCIHENYFAFAFFVIAGLTDVVDGYLARKLNQITDLGKILDPAADKLMIFSAVVAFVVQHVLPWYAAAVIFVKEFLMLIGAIFFFKKRNVVVYSNLFGKFAAFFMFVAVMLSFFHEYVAPVNVWALYIALACSVAALVQYAIITFRDTADKKTS